MHALARLALSVCIAHGGRAHQLNDIKSFAQSRGDRGRVRDKQTEYREQVFTMWNINGIKQPAVFRP